MFQKVIDKQFHVAWSMKDHIFINNYRIAALQFKNQMIQLFWIIKELSKSTNKI
jgi:hypothetical protein